MFEAGIPIDKVGGVSIGAFMGALWAIHRDIDEMTAKSRKWFYNMTRYSGLLDLTYPMTSLFTGGYFNWTLTETFDKGNFTFYFFYLSFFLLVKCGFKTNNSGL